HTRFSRDWSSDVCSSDLMLMGALNAADLFEIDPPTSASATQTTLDETVVLVGADGRMAYLDGAVDAAALKTAVGDILAARPDTQIGRASCRESGEITEDG